MNLRDRKNTRWCIYSRWGHAKNGRVINGVPWPGWKYGFARIGDLSAVATAIIEIHVSEKHHAVCTSIERCIPAFRRMENTCLLACTCRLIMREANGSDILITLHYYRYDMGTWLAEGETCKRGDFRATIRFNARRDAYGHYRTALFIVRRRTIELAMSASFSCFSLGRKSYAYRYGRYKKLCPFHRRIKK